MKVMVTGHRLERLGNRGEEVSIWLKKELKKLKPTVAICGMANGVDQNFAYNVLDLDIPLVAVYPHPKRGYSEEEKYLRENATEIIYYSKEYDIKNYTARDYYMVDHSDVVLAVWDGIAAGGTYKTAEYAKKQGKEVIYFPW